MEWTENLHFHWRPRLPLIRQTEAAECGVACLAMIAGWYGHRIDLPNLRSKFNISTHGMTFAYLIECAQNLKLTGRAVRVELEELNLLVMPCILHWDLNHFVVLKRVRGDKLEIHDPARGEIRMSMSQADRHFTGIALELTPTHDFVQRDERHKIRLAELIGRTVGLKAAMIRIFCFALALEVFALLSPLINQIVIDEVLVALDDSLLVLIVIAMLLMSTTQMLIGLARQWATLTMAVNFNMQWTANVFQHLLRLPIDWFEKRDIGNISAKFDAVNTIQNTLTTSILEALLDVLLIMGTLSMMLLYSVPLSMVALGAALLYCLLRLMWFSTLRKASEDSWTASTLESSHFLETLHGMLSLRVNGALPQRESAWRNLNVERRNSQLRESKLIINYDIANTVIGSVVGAAVLWFGAKAVLSGQFSVGMLVAYMSFQGRFTSSINGLIDKFFAWQMLDIYNERLADIVLTPKERSFQAVESVSTFFPLNKMDGPVVKLESVAFSYGQGDVNILTEADMCIMPGEVVALVGRSGCGKTTLAKLILGLYQPSAGRLRVFGIDHHQEVFGQVRQIIGAVMQEDRLFQGAILDNITFFAQEMDLARAQHCAALAQLHEDIIALPMGYQTLIGELGNSLSGGQKQRLLLARALYKRPRLLILDEATSHLDVTNEILIGNTLRGLGLTILLIAHRPETIASADRVMVLENGKLIPSSSGRGKEDCC
ncbi:MAG: peptidase domain-containing ABC transporter [Silvania sp.]